jgi:hypothetical protein
MNKFLLIRHILLSIIGIAFLSLSSIVTFGASNGNVTDPVTIWLPFEQYTSTDPSDGGSITTAIAKSILAFIPYVLALAVLSLIGAGIYYLISWGNEEKVKTAKSTLLYTIIGVIIATSAYTIANIVNSLSV